MLPNDAPGRVSRRERVLLAVVLLLALAVRLLHMGELHGDVLFESPPLDEERYVREARRLVGPGVFEPRAFWQPPGLLFVLAGCFRLFGDGLGAPRLVQAVLGTGACFLAWVLARRLLGARLAMIAAVVVALHAALVFGGAELLPATWAVTLDLGALALLTGDRGGIRREAAGLLLGVSALFTPTVLAFAAVVFVMLLRSRPRPAWVFAVAVLIPIVPVTIRNYQQSSEIVLVSTNGGLNFFIGNNPDYLATLAIRPGPRWTELTSAPEREARITAPGAQSAWFFRRGRAFWVDHPGKATALYLRKLALFFHATEIPRDTDLYAVRLESRVLRALAGPREASWPDLVLMPLALIGLVGSIRASPRWALHLPLAFVASQLLVGAAFFASARHRLPCVPVLAIFAVGALPAMARATPLTRLALVCTSVALAALCRWPVPETTLAGAGERDFYRGRAHQKAGRADLAIESFQRATAAEPNDPRSWDALGGVLAAGGRLQEAAAAWERAAAGDPGDLGPARMAAETLAKVDDRAGAVRVLETSIAAGRRPPSAYASEHLRLVELHLDSGDREQALGALRSALRASPEQARWPAEKLMQRRRRSIGDPVFWAAFAELLSDVRR